MSADGTSAASKKRGPLPFMKTMDDAVAICEKEHDNFYVTAFMIEAWLGEATVRAVTEYAEKKDAKDRRMQSGEVGRLFQEGFGHCKDFDFQHLFGAILRFAAYDDVQSRMVMKAFIALWVEQPPPEPPKHKLTPADVARGVAEMRTTLSRLCEWLDAVIHWQEHRLFYHSPVSFDPDPEKRELAVLGVNQRYFSKLSDFSKQWWEWHHGEAAERFKDSQKWPTVGKAMAATDTRQQKYPDVDEAIICLWPMLKKHNWTYRDLMNVANAALAKPPTYPCDREQDFAAYCNNVLGLRKSGGSGKTAPDGKPAGFDVAMRLCSRSPA